MTISLNIEFLLRLSNTFADNVIAYPRARHFSRTHSAHYAISHRSKQSTSMLTSASPWLICVKPPSRNGPHLRPGSNFDMGYIDLYPLFPLMPPQARSVQAAVRKTFRPKIR